MRYDDVILRWAKIATILFTAMAVVADVFGVVITRYIAYCWAEVFDLGRVIALMVVFYLGTVGGYIVLIPLYKMLSNMSKDKVFDRQNTKLRRFLLERMLDTFSCCSVHGTCRTEHQSCFRKSDNNERRNGSYYLRKGGDKYDYRKS